MNRNSPVTKILISVNQLFPGYLIDAKDMSNTLFTNFIFIEEDKKPS